MIPSTNTHSTVPLLQSRFIVLYTGPLPQCQIIASFLVDWPSPRSFRDPELHSSHLIHILLANASPTSIIYFLGLPFEQTSNALQFGVRFVRRTSTCMYRLQQRRESQGGGRQQTQSFFAIFGGNRDEVKETSL